MGWLRLRFRGYGNGIPRTGSFCKNCCSCGGKLIDTGETISKDEFDVEIKVVKRRHEYHIYRCTGCGTAVRMRIDVRLKEKEPVWEQVQALALSLMSTGNVALNKVRMLVEG